MAAERAGIPPDWMKLVKIAGAAKYLGAVIGPEADAAGQRRKQVAELKARTLTYATSHMAPSLVRQHDIHSAAVMFYVGQVQPPERLLRMPHRAVPSRAWPLLRHMGAPAPRPLAASLRAGMVRAALSMGSALDAAGAELRQAREPLAPLRALDDPSAQPDRRCWCTSALADVLVQAREEGERLLAAANRSARMPHGCPPGRTQRTPLAALTRAGGLEEHAAELAPHIRRWAARCHPRIIVFDSVLSSLCYQAEQGYLPQPLCRAREDLELCMGDGTSPGP